MQEISYLQQQLLRVQAQVPELKQIHQALKECVEEGRGPATPAASQDHRAVTAIERVHAMLNIIGAMRDVTSYNHDLIFTHNDVNYAEQVPPIVAGEWDSALMALETHLWALFPHTESTTSGPCPRCGQAWCTHHHETGACPSIAQRPAVTLP